METEIHTKVLSFSSLLQCYKPFLTGRKERESRCRKGSIVSQTFYPLRLEKIYKTLVWLRTWYFKYSWMSTSEQWIIFIVPMILLLTHHHHLFYCLENWFQKKRKNRETDHLTIFIPDVSSKSQFCCLFLRDSVCLTFISS